MQRESDRFKVTFTIGAMRTFRLTGGITHDQRRNTEEGEGLI